MRAQFKQICKTYPFQEKLWVTDNYIAANDFLQEMTLEGHGWLHIRVISPFALAQRVVSAYRSDLTFISQDTARMILQNIFKEAQQKKELHYFGHLTEPHGLIESLSHLLNLLKGLHISLDDVDEQSFLTASKGADLKYLYSAYQEFLKTHDLYDKEMCYDLAWQSLQEQKEWDVPDMVCVHESESLSEAAQRFMDLFSRGQNMTLKQEQGDEAEVLALQAKSVDFFISYSPWCEVRDVISYVLKEGIAWDQVEIVYSDSMTYLPLIQNLCRAKHIPLSCVEGYPLMQSKWGQCLLVLKQWIQQSFDVTYILELLRDRLILIPENLDYDRLLVVLYQLDLRFDLKRYMGFVHREIEMDDEDALELRFLQRLCRDLLALVKFDSKVMGMNEVSAHFKLFLEAYGLHVAAQDIKAKEYLSERLESLLEWDVKVASLSQGLNQMLRMLESQSIGRSGMQSETLVARPLHQTAFVQRPYVFCVGFNDQWLPGRMKHDALILDEERCKISPQLELSSHKLEHYSKHVKEWLQSVKGVLHISCVKTVPLRLAYGLMPSPLMLWAYRLATQEDYASYDEMIDHLSDSCAYGQSLCDWPVFVSKGTSTHWLTDGRKALNGRLSADVTAYDGHITLSDGIRSLELRKQEARSVSASSLQSLATCPFQYYLQHVLKLKEEDIEPRDPHTWLDAAQFGSLIHAIYFELMGWWSQHEHESLEYVQAHGETIVHDHLNIYQSYYSPPNPAIFKKESARIAEICKQFIVHESRRSDRKAKWFEVGFGRTQGDLKDDLSCDAPIKFHLKHGSYVMLSGSIDRVDQNAQGEYTIVDYKTGSSTWFKPGEVYKQGRMLQPFLYAYVLKDILRHQSPKDSVKIKETGYYYATHKGKFQEHLFEVNEQIEELQDVMGHVLDVIRDGTFVVNQGLDGKSGACQFCSASEVCTMYKASSVNQKFLEPQNEMLEALRKLKQYV